ncbi:MAG: peptidylprolyl isomerase [Bordetella sp.]|nr:MAG: peptidylprolyl isomerase [Bordetella sp.]
MFRQYLFFFLHSFFILFPIKNAYSTEKNKIDLNHLDSNLKSVDRIIATVNNKIITSSEYEDFRKKRLYKNSFLNNADLNDPCLEEMILDILEQEEAKKFGIYIDENQVYNVMHEIAKSNKFTIDQFRNELEKIGINFNQYRESLYKELIRNQIKEYIIGPMVSITDIELDNFLPTYNLNLIKPDYPSGYTSIMFSEKSNQFYTIAQIFIKIPENSSQLDEELLYKKGQFLLNEIRKGEDFHKLAMSFSEGDEALNNQGIIGTKLLEHWPDLFIQSLIHLKTGQTSGLLKSKNGFHIIKLINSFSKIKKSLKNSIGTTLYFSEKSMTYDPVFITKTHVSDIVIKTDITKGKEFAVQYLNLIRSRIKSGLVTFENMAKQFSQDFSASNGGDIGWINPGKMPINFENIMNSLKIGEISSVISLDTRLHLIQVKERKVEDISVDYHRDKAYQKLKENLIEFYFHEWLKSLRETAFVNNYLNNRI